MAVVTFSLANTSAASRGSRPRSLADVSTSMVFSRIVAAIVSKATLLVRPAYSQAAQMTPPALAMKSGTQRMPRSARRRSAASVQGFGAVGMHAARFLGELGAVLVAAADSRGSVAHADGLDVDELIVLKREGGSVVDLAEGSKGDGGDIVDAECDIWIPAARPDVINEDNLPQLVDALVDAYEGLDVYVDRKAQEDSE